MVKNISLYFSWYCVMLMLLLSGAELPPYAVFLAALSTQLSFAERLQSVDQLNAFFIELNQPTFLKAILLSLAIGAFLPFAMYWQKS